jgi:hypothetical protein
MPLLHIKLELTEKICEVREIQLRCFQVSRTEFYPDDSCKDKRRNLRSAQMNKVGKLVK